MMKTKYKKKRDYSKIIGIYVFVSLVLAIIGTVVMICIAPSASDIHAENSHVKSDYVLTLAQCILGILVLVVPGALERKISIQIPSKMMILYTLFIYASVFLGEVRSFYYNVPHWDTILHTFSGGMLGALGFSVIAILNNSDKIPVTLSPAFVACFTLCFAVALGVVWEIYEYTVDGILNTNMQKFALEDGTHFAGRLALADTMKDLIVDIVGALVMSVIGYVSLKYEKGWIDKLQIKRIKKEAK